jgi:hypothetical protein
LQLHHLSIAKQPKRVLMCAKVLPKGINSQPHMPRKV